MGEDVNPIKGKCNWAVMYHYSVAHPDWTQVPDVEFCEDDIDKETSDKFCELHEVVNNSEPYEPD